MATDEPTVQDSDAAREGASATRGAARDAVVAQRSAFGGVKWGAALFGWLSANGLAVLLIALLSAAGVALGLTQGVAPGPASPDGAAQQADAIGLGGAVALLVVLFVAYLAGGYVAGRMSRFHGVRQGVAVWLVGLLVVVALSLAGYLLGREYNVLEALDLPRIPIDEGTATTAGIVTLLAMAVVTLLGAVVGGRLGTRYHRRIDRAGFSA
jgi:hypothetical protein